MGALARRLRQGSAAIALTMGFAGGVLAADIQRPVIRPPVVVMPNWTGFYIGGHAGYGWGDPSTGFATSSYLAMNLFERAQAVGRIPTTLNPGLKGFSGGGHVGYNWQLQQYVFGIEADISSGAKGGSTFASAAEDIFPQLVTTQSNRLDWMGTVRGRLGWLWTPDLLIYGTGGLAYGAAKATTALSTVQTLATSACPGNAFCSLGSGSATLTGWVAGAGIEYAINAGWHARLEYLHFDLGDLAYAVQNASFLTGAFARPYIDTSARFYGDIVRAGVSYKFN